MLLHIKYILSGIHTLKYMENITFMCMKKVFNSTNKNAYAARQYNTKNGRKGQFSGNWKGTKR
jgi:hypothetical protein